MARKSLSRTTAEALGPIVVPLVTKVALPLALESMRRGGKFDTQKFFDEAKASLSRGVKKSRSDREELKEQISDRGSELYGRGSELYDEVRKQGADFLETLTEPVSQREIERRVEGNIAALRRALDLLVTEGFVERTLGPRNSLNHTLAKPFREVGP